MKKQLLQLLLSGIAFSGLSQETDPLFHPIDQKRPQKSYFPGEIRRLQFRNMEAFLHFAASEFDLPAGSRVAVLLNGAFVGTLDPTGNFTQTIDGTNLLSFPLDSVRLVVSEYDPAFRTRHTTANFFGKTDIIANPVKLPDTVAWNRFEPERIVVNRHIFEAEYPEAAAVAVRGGWFLGALPGINSVQAGAWLEIPISRRWAMQAEFSYTNLKAPLGRYIKSPFEEFTYSLNQLKGRVDLKYYLRKKYQRPYLLTGCFVDRSMGHLWGFRSITPHELLGPKTAFGIRLGAGYQFYSGLYLAVSTSPIISSRARLLPLQPLSRNLSVSVGWMIGRR